MKTKEKIHITLQILVAYCMITIITSTAFAQLKLDSVSPTLGVLGEPLNVTLKGNGFDENTKISMYLDIGNKKSIISSVDTLDSASGVTLLGSLAYLADGFGGLQIIDVNDPENPHVVSVVDTPGYAGEVAVSGATAYVADGLGGLQIIDVNDPENPCIAGVADTPGYVEGVVVSGTTAYVADGDGGLQIIDVSNPENPFITGAMDTPGYAWGVEISSSVAYVTDWSGGLQIIDISDSENPHVVSVVDSLSDARGVVVSEATAYVADGSGGLQIIDVKDPENPCVISITDTPGYAQRVAVSGSVAYVADRSGGLRIIDISALENPHVTGVITTQGYVNGVAVSGSAAYVADGDGGLQIMDVSNPENPHVVISVAASVANGVAVSGSVAYLADGGLQIIDVSNPENPHILSTVATPGYAERVAISDSAAYVADGSAGLQIIDVSNPENPHIIGAVATPGYAWEVAVSDSTVYVADLYGGLQIIDVSNPENPFVISAINTPGYANGVVVSDSAAYVADGSGGLQVIDVSDPENPHVAGVAATQGYANGVSVSDSAAYVADGSGGLQIIDVNDPENPHVVGVAATPGYANGVSVSGSTVYVADGSGGLQVIDVSNPENPYVVSAVDTPNFAFGVTVSDSFTYVADKSGGLRIFRIPPVIEIIPDEYSETRISVTFSPQNIAGHYTLRVFNKSENSELIGAVTFAPEDSDVFKAKAVILAGRNGDSDKEIWKEIQLVANYAYKALSFQGYSDDKIYYLSSDTNTDVNEDGINDTDAPAAYSELSELMETMANENPPASGLILYFVGHGENSAYRINADETIEAEELNTWLNRLQENINGFVIFIYDACQSGTFISPLADSSHKKRIVITSGSDEKSWFINDGRTSFSYQFWATIFDSSVLNTAFKSARNEMKTFSQTARIDADGDGDPDEPEDIATANSIKIGRGRISDVNMFRIGSVPEPQTLIHGNTETAIWADSLSIPTQEVKKVSSYIISPDDSEIQILLPYNDNDGRYKATYEDFTVEGTYTIKICAENTEGDLACRQTSVTQAQGFPKPESDDYEGSHGDNSSNQAKVIIIEDIPQSRTFHKPGDEDWTKFYGLSRQTYKIRAGNPSQSCNPVIDIFNTDGTRIIQRENYESAGWDEYLDWLCPKDGIYYVRVREYDPDIFATTYEFEIYSPDAPAISGRIEGTITHAVSGRPIMEARIRAEAVISGLEYSGLSLPDGTFMIHLPSGKWKMNVEADGYQPSVFQTDISEGEDRIMNLKLEPSSDLIKINGTVMYEGTPLCAMVLASGQHIFSCAGEGKYQLDVPLDDDGKITLFSFVDGLAPFSQILEPFEAFDFKINMSPDIDCPPMALTHEFGTTVINPEWVEIRGTVRYGTEPLCAMILANGQHTFSCDPAGEYDFEVPPSENGEITLFGFADGFKPFKEILKLNLFIRLRH